jgi:CRISPR system Cascade subunit CasC
MHFEGHVLESKLGTRTRRLEASLATRLTGAFGEEQAQRLAGKVVDTLKIGRGKKKGDTAYLLFYGRAQLDAVAEKLRGKADGLTADLSDSALQTVLEGLEIEKVFSTGHPLDVALFGRMVADVRTLRVDAAVQVAHALSTHEVDLEFDYFTAVDDEARHNQETGAGMIGTIGFNSATLYRYATVGLHQLAENLGDDGDATAEGVRHFVSSFARSVPSGYGNAFAHRTLPSLVAVLVREDQPVNLVSAFEDPVHRVPGPNALGIAATSAKKLALEHREAVRLWGDRPAFTAVCHSFTGEQVESRIQEAFGASTDFPSLLDRLGGHVGQWLSRTTAR